MTMQGIDVASYQAGLDPARVPCDFVIVKATQGAGYTNPDYRRMAEATLNAGKCLGIYHYIDGSGADAEATHFAQQFAAYSGRALIALDWERDQNRAWGNVNYLAQVIDRVIAHTGRKPLVYCSASVLGAVAPVASARDCGLWVAQYADNNDTGYQPHPWNEGAYQCAIRQFTSHGRLSGWTPRLDLDIAYMDRQGWERYQGGSAHAASSQSEKDRWLKVIQRLADETMRGEHGNGADRKRQLGPYYEPVQYVINQRTRENALPDKVRFLRIVSRLADETMRGEHGNGADRKRQLGPYYEPVQYVINHRRR